MVKKILLAAAMLAMAVLLILFPKEGLAAATDGLNLWIGAVVPALLPFMAASHILLEIGVVRLLSALLQPVTRVLFGAPGHSAFVLLASCMSGYPVGAALTSELYARNKLTAQQAAHIVRFTSVSGPVFMTGAVAAGMLSLPEAGIYLALTHYLAAVLTGVFLGLFGRRSRMPKQQKTSLRGAVQAFKKEAAASAPLGDILSGSIEKSVLTLLKVGGFIVLFSVITQLLFSSGIMDAAAWLYSPLSRISSLSSKATDALLQGGIEMTAGCSAVSSLNEAVSIKLPLIAAIIGFGGLSVHMQTHAVCQKSGLRVMRFWLAKSLQAVLSFGLCALALRLFPLTVAASGIGQNTGGIKTTALFGAVFALVALAILIIVKRRKLPLASAREL